ncbi:MAG: hypothetical protein WBG00_01560 [Thermoanaerobaculia bacterium]
MSTRMGPGSALEFDPRLESAWIEQISLLARPELARIHWQKFLSTASGDPRADRVRERLRKLSSG